MLHLEFTYQRQMSFDQYLGDITNKREQVWKFNAKVLKKNSFMAKYVPIILWSFSTEVLAQLFTNKSVILQLRNL